MKAEHCKSVDDALKLAEVVIATSHFPPHVLTPLITVSAVRTIIQTVPHKPSDHIEDSILDSSDLRTNQGPALAKDSAVYKARKARAEAAQAEASEKKS